MKLAIYGDAEGAEFSWAMEYSTRE